MFLSKSCIYGIRSVLFLAVEKNNNYTSIKEISEKLEIPFHYLTKILQILNRQGIVKSIKGPHGGITFNREPEKISIFDIITAIDGECVFEKCLVGDVKCSSKDPCVLHGIFYESRSTLQKDLKTKNIKDIAAGIISGDLEFYCEN